MRLRNAAATRRLFRTIVVGVSALAPPVAAVIGCGTSTSTGDGGLDASRDSPAPPDAPPTDACHALIAPDAQGCSWAVQLAGDLSTCPAQVGDPGNSSPWAVSCEALCGRSPLYGLCSRSGDQLNCAGCDAMGRPHHALDTTQAPVGRDVASACARMAYFEAASVDAFELLERDLEAHDAPRSLRRVCRQARADEVVHARMATAMAMTLGACPKPPPKPARRRRAALEALAHDNARDGCVRETFSALVATWQADYAGTAELRTLFARIARDEAAHAALAHRIDEWLDGLLSVAARQRVYASRCAAVEALRNELAASGRDATSRFMGWPDPHQARLLLEGLWA